MSGHPVAAAVGRRHRDLLRFDGIRGDHLPAGDILASRGARLALPAPAPAHGLRVTASRHHRWRHSAGSGAGAAARRL